MPSCRISVKVVPNASQDELVGWLGESLKIRISAPPTDGKANERLCEFVAERLGLSRGAVSLVSGASSRQKILSITEISLEELNSRFNR
jgi:uncharacterized protein (TIGR00251 family)